MIADWKGIVAIATISAAVLVIIKNTVIVAKFVTFLAELRPTITKMASDISVITLNSASAVTTAQEAKNAAQSAIHTAEQTREELKKHLNGQDRVLEEHGKILKGLAKK